MHYLLIFCQVGFFDLTQSSRSKNRLIFINMDMEHTIVMDSSLVRTGIAHAVYWDVFIYQWCNPFLSRQNGVKHFWKSIITYIPKVQTKFLYAAIWSHWQPTSIAKIFLYLWPKEFKIDQSTTHDFIVSNNNLSEMFYPILPR